MLMLRELTTFRSRRLESLGPGERKVAAGIVECWVERERLLEPPIRGVQILLVPSQQAELVVRPAERAR